MTHLDEEVALVGQQGGKGGAADFVAAAVLIHLVLIGRVQRGTECRAGRASLAD